MSTVYLLPDNRALDAIGFSVTTSETHTINGTLTAIPVENGSTFTDHFIQDPDTFSCEVAVTNSPHEITFFGDGIMRPGIGLGKGVQVTGFVMQRAANLVQEMWERLEKLKRQAEPLSILTSIKTYETMVLVHVELPRPERSKGIGRFRLDFQKLTIVSTKSVQAPQPREPRGNGKQSKGSQGGKEVDDASKEAGNLKSAAASLVDGDVSFSDLTAKFTGG